MLNFKGDPLRESTPGPQDGNRFPPPAIKRDLRVESFKPSKLSVTAGTMLYWDAPVPLSEITGQSISYWRKSMFDVTQKATEMIKEALKDQEKISAIRVVYNEGG
jgi:hypothetical protein